MSNKVNEATQAEGLNPQEENTQLVSTESIANIDELLQKSSGLNELKTVVNLSPTTITLDKVGESFRGVFVGFGTMQVNDEKEPDGKRVIDCAKFLIDKAMRINGGAVLLSELRSANVEVGTALEVKYTEKRGNVKIYSITLLG